MNQRPARIDGQSIGLNHSRVDRAGFNAPGGNGLKHAWRGCRANVDGKIRSLRGQGTDDLGHSPGVAETVAADVEQNAGRPVIHLRAMPRYDPPSMANTDSAIEKTFDLARERYASHGVNVAAAME